jgi:hypothetical protein
MAGLASERSTDSNEEGSGKRIETSRLPPETISKAMIRMSISPAAFDAIAATLPLGTVAVEPAFNGNGERHIWLEP